MAGAKVIVMMITPVLVAMFVGLPPVDPTFIAVLIAVQVVDVSSCIFISLFFLHINISAVTSNNFLIYILL